MVRKRRASLPLPLLGDGAPFFGEGGMFFCCCCGVAEGDIVPSMKIDNAHKFELSSLKSKATKRNAFPVALSNSDILSRDSPILALSLRRRRAFSARQEEGEKGRSVFVSALLAALRKKGKRRRGFFSRIVLLSRSWREDFFSLEAAAEDEGEMGLWAPPPPPLRSLARALIYLFNVPRKERGGGKGVKSG